MTFEFDTDTAVERAGEDRFAARLTDRWNTPAGPNGGYVLAVVARALLETVPKPHPISLTGHFLLPPAPGDVEIATELIRTGHRHATARATLSQGGKEVVTALGTFADLAEAKGRDLILEEPPALPAPEEAIDPLGTLDQAMMPPIAGRMDYRVGELPGFALGEPSGRPEFVSWIRFSDGREPDPVALIFLPDGMVPTVFEIGEIVSSTVEMTVHVRAVPAEGWLLMRVRTRFVIGGYHEEDVELWDSSGSLVAQARQLAMLAG